MSKGGAIAFYARVSSEAQARDHTIDSQIAALKERIAADGFQLEPDRGYVDDGCSGTNLQRLALERLRDAVAAGHVERIYVHAPDRLARSHAHQVLLIEEFRRAGAEVIFLNRSIGDTAEDNLLLQVQGIIAEYERTKILERVRRGRLHAARSGSVSALTGAPFGYRYVCRDQGGGVARFEIVEDEADIVRRIFAWVGLDRLSLREVCRRLQQMGCRSRRGLTRWNATTIGGMLTNPAYIGRAMLGRSRVVPAEPRLRLMRRNSRAVPNAMRRVRGPREECIEVAVPALVTPALFEAAQAQLEENRRRQRQSGGGPPDQVTRLDRQMTALRRGIDRLIDCYAGGFLDKAEFEPRIAGLKLRMSQIRDRQEAAVEAANAERELSLVVSRLEDFSARVNQGLDRLDWHGTRQIIHTLVRRIEIDRDSVEVVFRVPPMGGPSNAGPQLPRSNMQHCTDGYARLRGLCETHHWASPRGWAVV